MLAEPISPETTSIAQQGDEGLSSEIHSEADRYDGSRTPAEKQLLIWQLRREGRSAGDIARFLGMKPYTVKAVLDREDGIIAESRMLLKASALELTRHYIRGAGIAADKGKIEGIAAGLDRIGVTEPPKSQAQTQVGVSVVLHGGPEPVSLAKVSVQSETSIEQAQIPMSPISQLMYATDTPQVIDNTATCEPSVNITQSVVGQPQEPV